LVRIGFTQLAGKLIFACVDELQEALDLNPLSFLPWLPKFLQFKPKVIHIDTNSIVVPGLAGERRNSVVDIHG
jgi:hypothetical protein